MKHCVPVSLSDANSRPPDVQQMTEQHSRHETTYCPAKCILGSVHFQVQRPQAWVKKFRPRHTFNFSSTVHGLHVASMRGLPFSWWLVCGLQMGINLDVHCREAKKHARLKKSASTPSNAFGKMWHTFPRPRVTVTVLHMVRPRNEHRQAGLRMSRPARCNTDLCRERNHYRKQALLFS